MNGSSETEHFVTLFNHKFLPMGLCLHESLLEHAKPVCLWVICMDEMVEKQLNQLAPAHIRIIPLREIENPGLLAVKSERSEGEYCWTITPFAAQAVLDRDKNISRVTYVDADLYFFSDPRLLLQELEDSRKDILITEHHYEPRYDQTKIAGRFCVQFVTFKNTPAARNVMGWWQERCVEWCFARYEDGKFGDQLYLNHWPELFPGHVHVLRQNELIFTPWNVRWQLEHLQKRGVNCSVYQPVFYHFHGLRPESSQRVRAYSYYHLGVKAQRYYDIYLRTFSSQVRRMKVAGIPLPLFAAVDGIHAKLNGFFSWLTGKGQYRKIR